MFARALRPPTDTKVQYIPYGRQVEFAERLGVKAIQGATKNFEGMTVEELQLLDQVQQAFGFGGVDNYGLQTKAAKRHNDKSKHVRKHLSYSG